MCFFFPSSWFWGVSLLTGRTDGLSGCSADGEVAVSGTGPMCGEEKKERAGSTGNCLVDEEASLFTLQCSKNSNIFF